MLYLSVPQFPFVKKVSSHCLLLTGYVYSRSQKNLQPGPSLALRLECLVGLVSKEWDTSLLIQFSVPIASLLGNSQLRKSFCPNWGIIRHQCSRAEDAFVQNKALILKSTEIFLPKGKANLFQIMEEVKIN